MPVARNERIIHDPNVRPDHFVVVVVNTGRQIQKDVRLIGLGKRVLVKPHPARRRQFGDNSVVVEFDFVVSRFGHLVGVRKRGPVSALWVCCHPWIKLQRTLRWHNQKIAQVGVARAAEVRMAEANNCFILVFIARAVFIHIAVVLAIEFVRQRIGIGTQLHRTKRHGSTRIRMAHFFGANQRVYVGNQVGLCP